MGAWLLLGWGAVAVAAPQDVVVVDGLHGVEPSLLDLGVMSVGDTRTGTLQVVHTEGAALQIRSVGVTNIEGSAFAFDGERAFELPEGAVVDLVVPATPRIVGPHRAVVEVQSNGRLSFIRTDVRVMVRGGCLAGLPYRLDLGPVPAGGTVERPLLVWGCDGGVVLVDRVDSSRADQEVAVVDPPRVDASPQPLTLRFTAADDGQLFHYVEVYAPGDVQLGSFLVVANDCAEGDPRVWDADGDGVVDCAQEPDVAPWVDRDGDGVWEADGDCDDTDPTVHPGAPEVDGGVDDDCDGLVDEHLDLDGDGVPVPDDCDDGNPWVRPEGEEFCDGVDNDCDGEVDPGCVWPAPPDPWAADGGCGCGGPVEPRVPGTVVVLLAGLAVRRRRRA